MEHIGHPIGNSIRIVRKRRGITQAQLAELIDRSPVYISYLENGVKTPSLETLIDIINALEASADDILCDCIDHPRSSSSENEISEMLSSCTRNERVLVTQTLRSLISSLHGTINMS